jgi:hypothetical protein
VSKFNHLANSLGGDSHWRQVRTIKMGRPATLNANTIAYSLNEKAMQELVKKGMA